MFHILPDIFDTSRPIFFLKLLILTSNCLHKSLTTSYGSLEFQKQKKKKPTLLISDTRIWRQVFYILRRSRQKYFTSVVRSDAKHNNSVLLRCLQMVVNNFERSVLMIGFITEPDIWFKRPKCNLKNKLIFSSLDYGNRQQSLLNILH